MISIKICRCDGMVDVVDSKSTAGDSVPVRVRPPVPNDCDTNFCIAYMNKHKGLIRYYGSDACVWSCYCHYKAYFDLIIKVHFC